MSARAHLAGRDDGLVTLRPLLDVAPDWAGLLRLELGEVEGEATRAGERTGRLLGSKAFVGRLERRLGRTLARQKPGRKPKGEEWERGGAVK